MRTVSILSDVHERGRMTTRRGSHDPVQCRIRSEIALLWRGVTNRQGSLLASDLSRRHDSCRFRLSLLRHDLSRIFARSRKFMELRGKWGYRTRIRFAALVCLPLESVHESIPRGHWLIEFSRDRSDYGRSSMSVGDLAYLKVPSQGLRSSAGGLRRRK